MTRYEDSRGNAEAGSHNGAPYIGANSVVECSAEEMSEEASSGRDDNHLMQTRLEGVSSDDVNEEAAGACA